jgi:hypothetical protein
LTSLKFNPVKKDQLFYDRFEYGMGFFLHEVSCLRVLDHAYINDMITRRRQWREIAQQRWNQGSNHLASMLSQRHKDITEKTVSDLHSLADALLTTTAEFKLVVSMNQAYVYTNELGLFDQLNAMPELTYKTYSQAKVSRPKNTIRLKKSQHSFRCYFKLLNLSAQQKDHLTDFLITQQSHVRLSPALQQWIDLPFTRIQDYFFVDHDSESWLTMLSLVHPGIIRKTMHIITDK